MENIRPMRRWVVLTLLSVLFLSVSIVDGIAAVRDLKNIEVNEQQLQEAVASRALTWLTGSSSNNDYISVGRTANYFGFVALRVASGQSLSRSNVAKDTLAVLSQPQRDVLIELLTQQQEPFGRTREARFRINRALEGMLVGETLSRAAFLELGRAYGASEAGLGQVIAQSFGEVAQTLSAEQKKALSDIRTTHISGQGSATQRQGLKLKLSQESKKELVNLAARFLSWTTGSVEFNDFEVVGKPSQHFGFVSLRIDSNHGVRRGEVAKEVLNMLTVDQRKVLSKAAAHDAREFKEFLTLRGNLMRHLEVALINRTIDAEKVQELGAVVGESEAKMTWSQALAMIELRNSLSEAQSSGLLSMRAKYTANTGTLPEDPIARGRQLYAQCILCHDSASQQSIAPGLSAIVGREIASDSSFNGYSLAIKNFANTHREWNEGLLAQFLKAPKTLIPGTYMGFDGLERSKDIEALIAFLKSRN